MSHDGALPFAPACMTAEDLPPNDEKPPDITEEQWGLIDFLATPPDLRDLHWEPSMERKRCQTMAEYLKQHGISSSAPAKWMSRSPWFRHYLQIVKDQRQTHDHMVMQMTEAMYIKGMSGDQRSQGAYMNYMKDQSPPESSQPAPAGDVAPSEMTDEALNALLDGPEV